MTNEEAINIIEDVTWQDNGRHYSPNGWICVDCQSKEHPEYEIDEW